MEHKIYKIHFSWKRSSSVPLKKLASPVSVQQRPLLANRATEHKRKLLGYWNHKISKVPGLKLILETLVNDKHIVYKFLYVYIFNTLATPRTIIH